jgi:hypothetical protein
MMVGMRMKGIVLIWFLAGTALVALAATTAGAGAADVRTGAGPCAEDIAKFCKDVQPGGGRIVACMKRNEASLSPACRQHIAQVKERAQEARAACHDDVLRFCGDVEPGQGRIVACLKQHEQDLTSDCRAEFARKSGQRRQ